MSYLLSIVWNSIGIGGPAHGIVTKTVHKSLPGGDGVGGSRGGSGGRESRGCWVGGVVGLFDMKLTLFV